MDKAKYIEYAKLRTEISDDKKSVAVKENELTELDGSISINDDTGMFPTKITSHAFEQISTRLEDVAYKNPIAYKEIFGKPSNKSMFLPSNIKSFIITMVSKALDDDTYKSKKSRSSGGVEYIYNVKISKWGNDKDLFFTIIVENNVVKTGYFNMVDKRVS